MSVTIEIEGLDRLQGKLKTLESGQYLASVLQAAALDIKGYMGWYPPSTIANDSSQLRWYERGFGPRWRRKDGTISGYHTSEMLDRKWAAARPHVSARGLSARVGVRVSYAPYVQSKEHQAWFHRARGWRTDADAVRERGPHIIRQVQSAVQDILKYEATVSLTRTLAKMARKLR